MPPKKNNIIKTDENNENKLIEDKPKKPRAKKTVKETIKENTDEQVNDISIKESEKLKESENIKTFDEIITKKPRAKKIVKEPENDEIIPKTPKGKKNSSEVKIIKSKTSKASLNDKEIDTDKNNLEIIVDQKTKDNKEQEFKNIKDEWHKLVIEIDNLNKLRGELIEKREALVNALFKIQENAQPVVENIIEKKESPKFNKEPVKVTKKLSNNRILEENSDDSDTSESDEDLKPKKSLSKNKIIISSDSWCTSAFITLRQCPAVITVLPGSW